MHLCIATTVHHTRGNCAYTPFEQYYVNYQCYYYYRHATENCTEAYLKFEVRTDLKLHKGLKPLRNHQL
jgi:hypothetical protein